VNVFIEWILAYGSGLNDQQDVTGAGKLHSYVDGPVAVKLISAFSILHSAICLSVTTP